MKTVLSAFSILFITAVGLSQKTYEQEPFTDPGHLTCDKNYFTELLFTKYPQQRAIAESAAQALDKFSKSYEKSGEQEDDVFIIPVVFHIIHIHGTENISNEQIKTAIEVLNEDYSANTPGIGSVVSDFQSRVANVGFEFRLAQLDPEGNCTDGIVRVQDEATLEGGENLKSVSPSWDRSSYLNIWVCKTITSGAAGYAFLPSSVNGIFGESADGIVILHNYVGDMGTSNSTRSHALTHEVGHWANLQHTWGTSNTPTLDSNCDMDDGVFDTPNTIGWQSCNLSGATCGSLDNVQNFMDYSYCYRMYTTGQKNRMRAALSSSIAQRNQLHSDANLVQTGVVGADVICLADFMATSDVSICAGDSVSFEDISYNGVLNRQWTFNGGSPSTSVEEGLYVTYDSPGKYSVSLNVSNTNGSESTTKTEYITVLTTGQNDLPFQESFEAFNEITDDSFNWTVENDDNGPIKWVLTDNAAYSGNKSVYVHGRQNDSFSTERLYSPTFDLTGLTENAEMSFKYAHARRNNSSDDKLQIFFSRNCGRTWNIRKTIDIDDLPTVSGFVSGEFVPTSLNSWQEVIISNITSFFFTDECRVRFDYTSYQGNNLYIDDINFYDPTITNVEGISFLKTLKLFPNPLTGQSAILEYTLQQSGDIDIFLTDVTGRELLNVFNGIQVAGQHRQIIHTETLSAGVYLVGIRYNGEQTINKLVVQ